MSASGLTDAVNYVLQQVGEIAHDWSADDIVHSRPNNLFQLVRIWNDQVSREKKGEGYLFEKPACFVELKHMGNESMLSGVTRADYEWVFHIVDMQLDAGDGVGMDENKTIYLYRDAVKQAISGMQPPNCSTLFAIEENPDYTHDDVYHYKLVFKCSFTDIIGSYETKVRIKEPNTNMDLNIGFGEPPAGTDPLTEVIIPT